MSDPQYRISHLEEIHVTATETAALSSTTRLDGLKTFNHAVATTLTEMKHLNSTGWSEHVPTWKSGSGTLAGDCQKGSTTQAVLTSAIRNGTPIYVSAIDTPDAAVGAHKGWRFKFFIESSETPREAGNLVTFSYPLKQDGASVEILGTT